MKKTHSRSLIVLLSTAPSVAVAKKISRILVKESLVACVNIIPAITSIYSWKGKIESSSECMLVMKTTPALLATLEKRFHALHPYEVPEFVALKSTHVAKKYLAWVNQN